MMRCNTVRASFVLGQQTGRNIYLTPELYIKMYLYRPATFVLLCLVVTGCLPTQDDTPLPRLYDNLEYKDNVSRLLGHGGKTVTVGSKTLATDIIWKDSSGSDRSLLELQGDVIVLNMWATWCIPCLDELPYLKEISEEYAPQGVHMIGISIDRAKEPFKSVIDFGYLYDLHYQLVVDSSATAYINYGGTGTIPMTFVIDRQGYIQYIFPAKVKREDLIDAIESLL